MDEIPTANEVLGSRFEAALVYASAVHAHQRRKGGDIPYVSHLLAVAAMVIEDGAAAGRLSEDEAIAALLHDAAEDAGGETRLRDIQTRFGERVAEIVTACSDTFETPKPPWRARKEAYIAHLEDADEGTLRVSLADKVHNARAILADYRLYGDALWDRFDPDADALWYYRSLSELFSRRMPGPLAEELARTVTELDRLTAPTARAASIPAPDVVTQASARKPRRA
jgi:(p)ppGpp synthase/HD superfamily hydrolase